MLQRIRYWLRWQRMTVWERRWALYFQSGGMIS